MPEHVDIVIRPPQPGDGDGLAHTWLDAGTYYAHLQPDLFQIPEADGLAASIEAELLGAAEHTFVRVAEVDAQVVGFIGAGIRPPLANASRQLVRDLGLTQLVIDALVVQQAYWHRGVGRQLVEAAEAWGQSKGAVVVLVDTFIESPVSVPFYEQTMAYRRKSVRFRKAL
jgi:GNAT superfamily N-acetyltransferase